MSAGPRGRIELGIALLCLVAGAIFFTSLNRLWPLADTNLVADPGVVRQQAVSELERLGFDLDGYRVTSALTVDTRSLNYVEPTFGSDQAQAWIHGGFPLVEYRADLKRRGERIAYAVWLHPTEGLLGWVKRIDEDYPGAKLDEHAARELAQTALRTGLGLDASTFEERSYSSTERVARRDHGFLFERLSDDAPVLTERVQVRLAGAETVAAHWSIHVPPEFTRTARAAEAPGRALETLGFVLLALTAIAAFFIFLRRLQLGHVQLGRAMVWPSVVFFCLMGTYALERPSLFRFWEPLWPKWVSDFQYLSMRAFEGLLIVLLLLIVTGAGDALDRHGTSPRGQSLFELSRGRFSAGVVRASWRGFLVGLLCGGTLATAVVLLQSVFGAQTAIQPRGFFFYTLNTASPAATSVLFFLGVALAEELGYRFFAGTWIMNWTGRRWLAIWIPALIYGLTHTRLDFLPPAEPWWGRALALTLVGAVWGWAFLRYDALTVVLSHFTADLFIFNWPRLDSGQPLLVSIAAATIAVPLVPALVGWGIGLGSRGGAAPSGAGSGSG